MIDVSGTAPVDPGAAVAANDDADDAEVAGPEDPGDPAGGEGSGDSRRSKVAEPVAATVGLRRPGRPRDARVDEAILEAAADVLAKCGPGGFTVDAVASRAGVGKATVYRRWPSRADLLLATATAAVIDIKDPDTGSVRADMVFVLSALAVKLRLTNAGRLLPALAAEAAVNPDMSRTLAAFVDERRQIGVTVVERAVERGELPPDTDVDLLIDLVSGPIFYRTLVARRPVEPEEVERLIDAALGAVASGAVRST